MWQILKHFEVIAEFKFFQFFEICVKNVISYINPVKTPIHISACKKNTIPGHVDKVRAKILLKTTDEINGEITPTNPVIEKILAVCS